MFLIYSQTKNLLYFKHTWRWSIKFLTDRIFEKYIETIQEDSIIQLSDEEKSNEYDKLFTKIKEETIGSLEKEIKRFKADNIKVPKLSIDEWESLFNISTESTDESTDRQEKADEDL